MQNQTSSVVHFGVFQVDLGTGELRKAGLLIRLQEQPFKILVALLEKPGDCRTVTAPYACAAAG
jgi:DNA-binding winged helix-turn-helix (wHTH) protein